jgi:tRNA (mo5U34)-methyltransferase
MEQITPNLQWWDTVFSMGVLYHRRSPFDHLHELRNALRPGGEVVLETLVIDGDESSVLVPEGRYARMNNVWFLPSAKALASWMTKAGFVEAEIVDISVTTTDEQRHTDWKPGTSLPDYLDASNPELTQEGHPAPKRAIIVARKPDSDQRLPRYKL